MSSLRESSPVRYLRVIGRLYRDGQLRLRLGYLKEGAPAPAQRPEQREPLLEAHLFDAEGALLASHPLDLHSGCAPGGNPGALAVRGWVPLHPSTRRVSYVYRGRTLLEEVRRQAEPEVKLTWQPSGRVRGKRKITWKATHEEYAPLQYFLRYSHTGGQSWERIGLRTTESSCEVDFDGLPGGERCLLAVVATDGMNTTTVESALFTVAAKPCRPTILLPLDGSQVREGECVRLLGQGYWLEDACAERGELTWSSSIDGELGRGQLVDVPCLSPGEHQVTLRAGTGSRRGECFITLRCGDGKRRR